MGVTWNTMGTDRRVQEVDCWATLDEALEAMSKDSWEDTSRKLVDWIANEEGDVVAVAIFGPDLELLVTCSDGQRLTYPVPDFYKE